MTRESEIRQKIREMVQAVRHIDSDVTTQFIASVVAEETGQMPFGKFCNQRFEDIPSSYVDWFIREMAGHEELKSLMRRSKGISASTGIPFRVPEWATIGPPDEIPPWEPLSCDPE